MKNLVFLFTLFISFVSHSEEPTTLPREQKPQEANSVVAPEKQTSPPIKSQQNIETKSKESNAPVLSDFGKLGYLPASGTVFAEIGYSMTTLNSKISSGGLTVTDIKSNQNEINYGLGYGLSDKVAIGVSSKIATSSSNDYTYGSGSSLDGTKKNYLTSGHKDPELAAVWRIRNGTQHKTKTDLAFGFRPKIQTARSASSTTTGNKGTGRNEYRLGLNFYKEFGNSEIQLSAERSQYAAGKSEDASDSSKTDEQSAYGSSAFQLSSLTKVSTGVLLGAGFSLINVESNSDNSFTNGVSTSKTHADPSFNTVVSAEARILLDEKSMFKISLSYFLPSTQTMSVDTTNLDYSLNSGTNFTGTWVQEF